MRNVIIGVGLLSGLLLFGADCRAQRFSPDGRWIAFVHSSEAASAQPADIGLRWLLGSQAVDKPFGARTERLWAVNLASRESVLLDEVEGRLTEPSWARNGSALAFGRLLPAGRDDALPARFELVLQDQVDHKRVVASWTWEGQTPELADLTRNDIALSPDATLAAAPMLKPAGIVVVRVADGKALKQIAGATRPAWSDDNRLACVQSSEHGVVVLNLESGASQTIVDRDSPPGWAGPRWGRDGRELQLVYPDASMGTRLERLRAGSDGIMKRDDDLVDLPDLVAAPKRENLRCAFGLDHDEEALFTSVYQEGQPSVIGWFIVRGGSVHKRYNPVLETVPITALGVSPRPGERLLTFRPAGGERAVPPGVSDPDKETFEPLMPDEFARQAWIEFTFDAMGRLIDGALPAGDGADWRKSRPTRLPGPGQLEANDPAQLRLVRLAKMGRKIVDLEPANGSAALLQTNQRESAAMVFDAILGDGRAALRRLDVIEPRVVDPDARGRLLGLRAQILMTLRAFDAAGPMVEYLRERADQGASSGKVREDWAWLGGLETSLKALEAGQLEQPNVPAMPPISVPPNAFARPAAEPPQPARP